MKVTYNFKTVVMIVSILLMQVPCKAMYLNDETKKVICFVGEKVVVGCFAAASAVLTYQGIMRFFKPRVLKEKQEFYNDGELYSGPQRVAPSSRDIDYIEVEKVRSLFPRKNELIQSGCLTTVGVLGLGLSRWLMQRL